LSFEFAIAYFALEILNPLITELALTIDWQDSAVNDCFLSKSAKITSCGFM
jgi:hypothetical protein